MRLIFKTAIFSLVLLVSSCVAKKKSIESYESKKELNLSSSNQVESNLSVKTDNEFKGFSSSEIASFANMWKFGYDGSQGEGFKMYVNQTEKGFEIGAEGKGTASAEGESKNETSKAEIDWKETASILAESVLNSQERISVLETQIEEIRKKDKFSIDVPVGVYIVAGILLILSLLLWWFFGRPKGNKLPT